MGVILSTARDAIIRLYYGQEALIDYYRREYELHPLPRGSTACAGPFNYEQTLGYF